MPSLQARSNETATDKVKKVKFMDNSSAVGPLEGAKNGGTTYRPTHQTLGTAQNLERPFS